MEEVMLTVRDRSTGLQRAVECDANGVLYTSGSGGGAGAASTIADGTDVAQGSLGDVEVAGAGNASVIAILKRIRTLLASPFAVNAAAAAFVDGADVAQGLTTDAAVFTDAVGTVKAHLRGLVKLQAERMPAALGQQTMVLSLPVVLPSNQSDVPVLAGAPFTATLGIDDIAADTMYQLIDLSDAANYPHTSTNKIILKRVRLHAEKKTDGEFNLYVGVVIENDATDGTAKWLHCFRLENNGNPTDSSDRFAQPLEFNLDLEVSGGALVNYVTNLELANDALLKNDVARTSPVGTANPGVGDLMFYVDETGGAGTVDFTVSADYDTE